MGNGKNHGFVIQTRQKDDVLFEHDDVIAVGTPVALPARLVAGYGSVKFFSASDVTFQIRVEEACAADGPWTETDRLSSAIDTAGVNQVVCTTALPCGAYMRVFIDALAVGMAAFSFCGMGHPIGGALGEGGGGGASTIKDCATDTEASIKSSGALISPSPCDGGVLIAGRDTSALLVQRHILVDSLGRLIISGPTAALSSASDESVVAFIVRAALSGRDSSAAAGSQIIPIEARQYASQTDLASNLYGAVTNARLGAVDPFSAVIARMLATPDNPQSAGSGILGMTQMRESAYHASVMGRRFYYTHQTPGTVVTGQTSYVATTPTFMLSNTSGTNVVIIRSLTLSQTGTVAGGLINVLTTLSTTNDFSSGGTSVTGQNPNEGSAVTVAANITFRFNPTATGTISRLLASLSVPASLGTITTIDYKDAVMLGNTSSSWSCYTHAATPGPSWFFVLEVEIVPNS